MADLLYGEWDTEAIGSCAQDLIVTLMYVQVPFEH